MLAESQTRIGCSGGARDESLKRLNKELVEVSTGIERLYEAVEKGVLPADDTLTQRSEKLQKRRQSILLEIAGLKRERQMPVLRVGSKSIKALTTSLCEKAAGAGFQAGEGVSKAPDKRDSPGGESVAYLGKLRGTGPCGGYAARAHGQGAQIRTKLAPHRGHISNSLHRPTTEGPGSI